MFGPITWGLFNIGYIGDFKKGCPGISKGPGEVYGVDDIGPQAGRCTAGFRC